MTQTILLNGTKSPQKPAPSADPDFKQNVDDLAKNPLERTWRSNKEGTVRLQSVPNFKGDKYAEREWVKVCTGARLKGARVSLSFVATFGRCFQILGQTGLWRRCLRTHYGS